MSGGLTNEGYIASTMQEEVDDLNSKVLANVDGSLDLSPDQPLGQLIGIFAAKLVAVEELGATVYNALNPAAAEGALLVNDCALTGTFPQVATYSKAVAQLSLNASTTVFAGATAVVNGQPQNIWVLENDAGNATGGPAVVSATFRSQSVGPFAANAHTLQIIGTPTLGWTAVDNSADAVPGLTADTDTTLRAKRNVEVLGQGSGDLDAIRAAVFRVPGVIQCFVFENTTLFTDATGLPGKAFRVVIWDGASPAASNDAVAQAIWDSKPAGIQPFGTTSSGNATDSTGVIRVIAFDRAVQVPIWVTLTTTPGSLSTANTAAVKAALAAYAVENFNLGVTVVALALRAQAIIAGVTTDVPTFLLDPHSTPTDVGNIAITGQQIATLSTANILVNGI